MNKSDAVALESTCEQLLSDATKMNCTISMTLSGNIKIQFSSSYMTISKYDMCTPVWISFSGEYEELQQFIRDVQRTIKDHADEFDALRFSYEHINMLDYRRGS